MVKAGLGGHFQLKDDRLSIAFQIEVHKARYVGIAHFQLVDSLVILGHILC
jgi:hypothetical protein